MKPVCLLNIGIINTTVISKRFQRNLGEPSLFIGTLTITATGFLLQYLITKYWWIPRAAEYVTEESGQINATLFPLFQIALGADILFLISFSIFAGLILGLFLFYRVPLVSTVMMLITAIFVFVLGNAVNAVYSWNYGVNELLRDYIVGFIFIAVVLVILAIPIALSVRSVLDKHFDPVQT